MSDEIRAAGTDPDSQKRALKTAIAAAETSGDQTALKRLRADLARLDAAGDRAAAAEAKPEAAKTPPTGRTAAPTKSTTAKST